jgi:CBS domain-containing protein
VNIRDIYTHAPVTIRESEDLVAAARLMREHHIGYLVVVEPHVSGSVKPVGVLTDRDIVVSVIAKGTDPRELRVGDVMTRKPVMIDESKSLAAALSEMRRIGVRRMPVVGAPGELLGVLSLDEVLDALAEELLAVVGSIRSELRQEAALRP